MRRRWLLGAAPVLASCGLGPSPQTSRKIIDVADGLLWNWQGTIKTSVGRPFEARYIGEVQFVRTVPKPYRTVMRHDVTLKRASLSSWTIDFDYIVKSVCSELEASLVEIAVPPHFVIINDSKALRGVCNRAFKVWYQSRNQGYEVNWPRPQVRKLPEVNVWVFDSVALGKYMSKSLRGRVPEMILPFFPID